MEIIEIGLAEVVAVVRQMGARVEFAEKAVWIEPEVAAK